MSDQDSLMSDQDSLMSDQDSLMSDQDSLMSDQDSLMSDQDSLMSDQDSLMSFQNSSYHVRLHRYCKTRKLVIDSTHYPLPMMYKNEANGLDITDMWRLCLVLIKFPTVPAAIISINDFGSPSSGT